MFKLPKINIPFFSKKKKFRVKINGYDVDCNGKVAVLIQNRIHDVRLCRAVVEEEVLLSLGYKIVSVLQLVDGYKNARVARKIRVSNFAKTTVFCNVGDHLMCEIIEEDSQRY